MFISLCFDAFSQRIQLIEQLKNSADSVINSDPGARIKLANRTANLGGKIGYPQEKVEGSDYLYFAIYVQRNFNQAGTYYRNSIKLGNKVNTEKQMRCRKNLASLVLMYTKGLIGYVPNLDLFKHEDEQLALVSNQLTVAKSEIATINHLLIGTILTTVLLTTVLVLIIISNRIKTRTSNKLISLNHRNKNQKKRLEEGIEALDKLNKEKDLQMGMVAHDIRSPLNKIDGLVKILQLQNGVNHEQREVYNMIRQTISDANKLADELLQINKIESGLAEKSVKKLQLKQFAEDVIEQYQVIASHKSIDLKYETECSDLEFKTDHKMLQRILENLISNAIKFSQPSSKVLVTTEYYHEKIIFHVIDRGLGIPQKEQQLIFTKFGKTSTRPTNGESSNGLGLYIEKELAKNLGGEVTFESEEGKGSKFSVSLPA